MDEEKNKRKQLEEETKEKIEKLIEKVDENPYDPQRYYALGCCLTELQSFEQAEELFKRALNVFEGQKDKQALLHYGLGNVFYATGLFKEASAEFKMLNGSKYESDAMLMMAQTELSNGNHQKALAYALTAFEKGNNQTRLDSCIVLGDSFLALGCFDQACEYYDLYLKDRPNDKHAVFMRGVVETGLGKAPDAYFGRAKQLDKEYYSKMIERLDDISKVINKGKQGGKDDRTR